MSKSSHTAENTSIPRSRHYKGPFGRLFRELALHPWRPQSDNPVQAEADIRAFAESAMSEADDQDHLDNNNLPAGYTYFGQFVDHDITFDPTSDLQKQNDPDLLHNFRTPRLDLDSIYGEGPDDEPFMYDKKRGGMLLLGTVKQTWDRKPIKDSSEPDLPRNAQGTALIGDKRNDENLIVSQFQLSMLRLHNRIYGQLIGKDPQDLSAEFPINKKKFHEAQRILRWFYQYVIWNDFVKRLVKDKIWESVLVRENGKFTFNGQFYNWKNQPFIPVEFAVSAYRFGHTLIRPGYKVNLNTDVGLGFQVELPIFAGANEDPHDLSGFRFLPHRHTLQWDWFFKMDSSKAPFPQPSRRIDPKLSSAVSKIPDDRGGTNALAALNLLRSWRMNMPKGSDIAAAMGFQPHAIADPHEDILWHYILKEAALIPAANSGRMLGNVGGTIVAEVLGGLLFGDPLGYIKNSPNWTPASEPEILALMTNGKPENGTKWEVADLIRASGAPVSAADVKSTINTGQNPPK